MNQFARDTTHPETLEIAQAPRASHDEVDLVPVNIINDLGGCIAARQNGGGIYPVALKQLAGPVEQRIAKLHLLDPECLLLVDRIGRIQGLPRPVVRLHQNWRLDRGKNVHDAYMGFFRQGEFAEITCRILAEGRAVGDKENFRHAMVGCAYDQYRTTCIFHNLLRYAPEKDAHSGSQPLGT